MPAIVIVEAAFKAPNVAVVVVSAGPEIAVVLLGLIVTTKA
jgi:hypothetical protein